MVSTFSATYSLCVKRWSRRALTIPAALIAWVLSVLTSPALAALGLLIDLLRKDRALPRLRFVGALLIFLTCESLGLLGALVLWPLAIDRERFILANLKLQALWTTAIFRGCQKLYNVRVDVQGDAQGASGPALIFVRHASVADVLLPAIVLSNRLGLRLRYVLKEELIWDPCLDVVGHRLRNVFVARDSDDSDRQIRAVRALATDLGPKDGVVIFPEGTRFSKARLAKLQKRCVDRAGDYAHVLPPRPGGPLGLIAEAKGADIVVLSHVGLEGIRRFGDLIRGALINATWRVKLERLPAAQVPRQDEARYEWLHQTWRGVDAFVGSLEPEARSPL